MNDKKCGKCGLFYKDSTGQKMERTTVQRMLKMINVAGIEEAQKESKEWCYNCWKKKFRALMKPFAQQLGKVTKEW